MIGNMDACTIKTLENKLKCVAISDTHGLIPKDLPEGDLLFIAGDISPLDYQGDQTQMLGWFYLEFLPWVESVPFKKVILVAGNHDFFLQNIHRRLIDHDEFGHMRYSWRSAAEVTKKLFPGMLKGKYSKLVYLCDSSFNYEGRRIYGTPWIRDLSRWAFYLDNDSLMEKYKNIPKQCDVIITHMPPKIEGLGEVIQGGCFNTGADYGSPELAEVLKTRDFKYALCGHVHSGQHLPVELDGKKLVNVSLKNEDYKEMYYPFEFEI